jgi:hypothetical protein
VQIDAVAGGATRGLNLALAAISQAEKRRKGAPTFSGIHLFENQDAEFCRLWGLAHVSFWLDVSSRVHLLKVWPAAAIIAATQRT